VRVLITGGAGFIGSTLALSLAARHADWEIVAADNLFRRGSELNLPRLRSAGVAFVHADVRHASDLARVGPVDALVECSAEPSVMAAVQGGEDYVFDTNLVGARNCLSFAAFHKAQVIFLSTSRVYPLRALERLRYDETETRFALREDQPMAGASAAGIAEDFPLAGARTLYGATKLAAELLVAETAETHGLRAVVNRCGVVAGPWQMGKVDQGVFTHWALSHVLGRELAYIGFGGEGRQVRDLLHVEDLADLLDEQLGAPEAWAGATVNVGGGAEGSLSLRETTELCRELTGRDIPIGSVPETRPGDVPVYISDCRALFERTSWRPRRGPREILADIVGWIRQHETLVTEAMA
jgi:CDP-paratose 2-epimerase